MYVEHPLIRPHSVMERGYQRSMAQSCLGTSTLLVLPTGLGKTVVALRVAAEVLHERGGKVLFLAPTKPLVVQIASYLRDHLVGMTVDIMTGENRPEQRKAIWNGSNVIVATPQSVANDLDNGVFDLDGASLLVFDEAHRAVGNYAYVRVAMRNHGALVLGMTASPGATRKRIAAVCSNLGVREMECRNEGDVDVSSHVHHVAAEMIEVDVPEHMIEVQELFRRLQRSSLDILVGMHLIKEDRAATVPYLLQVNKTIQSRMGQGGNRGYLFRAMSAVAAAIKVAHAIELAECQSTAALSKYIERLRKEAESRSGSRASRKLVASTELNEVVQLLDGAAEHPKMRIVRELVEKQLSERPSSRVFLVTRMATLPGAFLPVRPRRCMLRISDGTGSQKITRSVLATSRPSSPMHVATTTLMTPSLSLASTLTCWSWRCPSSP